MAENVSASQITPEQWGAWKQSPVGKVFFGYLGDFVIHGREYLAESILAKARVDEQEIADARGRLLAIQEIATLQLRMIQDFYSTERLDERRPPTPD